MSSWIKFPIFIFQNTFGNCIFTFFHVESLADSHLGGDSGILPNVGLNGQGHKVYISVQSLKILNEINHCL